MPSLPTECRLHIGIHHVLYMHCIPNYKFGAEALHYHGERRAEWKGGGWGVFTLTGLHVHTVITNVLDIVASVTSMTDYG